MTSPSAEFHVFQGVNQIARVILYPGASASIPTTETVVARGFTNVGDLELTSNEVELCASAVVRAQIGETEGFQDFFITCEDGGQPDAIILQNRRSEPVTFRLTRPDSTFQIITAVPANADLSVSTAQQWTAYAIVNGITTPTADVTNPDATIVLKAQNQDEGFVLDVA